MAQSNGSDGPGSGPRRAIHTDDVLEAFEDGGELFYSTAELVDVVGASKPTVLKRLDELRESGDVERKVVGNNTHVWYLPEYADSDSSAEHGGDGGGGGGGEFPEPEEEPLKSSRAGRAADWLSGQLHWLSEGLAVSLFLYVALALSVEAQAWQWAVDTSARLVVGFLFAWLLKEAAIMALQYVAVGEIVLADTSIGGTVSYLWKGSGP